MKLPKTANRYCPKCKKHQEVAISQSKQLGRNKAHPMSRGSQGRLKIRGRSGGFGNLGRLSRGAIASFKMTGKKTSKKTDLRYKCKTCNKSIAQKKGFRTKKIEMVAKQ